MAEKSLIRIWRGKPATFVEDDRKGEVVVTVDNKRIEMPKSEWESLTSYEGEVPHTFDKPPSKT